jgi:hypothetical protein
MPWSRAYPPPRTALSLPRMQQLRQHASIRRAQRRRRRRSAQHCTLTHPVPRWTLSYGQAELSAANRHCDEAPPRSCKARNLTSYLANAASGARRCGSNFTAKSPG